MMLAPCPRPRIFLDPASQIDPPSVLLLDELRQAAAAYHEATRRVVAVERLWERFNQRLPGAPDAESYRWERQYLQRYDAARQARLHLTALILILHQRIDDARELPRMGGDWAPCGIILDDHAYVVGQNPAVDEAEPFLFTLKGHDLLFQNELSA